MSKKKVIVPEGLFDTSSEEEDQPPVKQLKNTKNNNNKNNKKENNHSTTTTTTSKSTSTSTQSKPNQNKKRVEEEDDDEDDDSDLSDEDYGVNDGDKWRDDFLTLLPMLSSKSKKLVATKDLRFFKEEDRQQIQLEKREKKDTYADVMRKKIMATMDKEQYEEDEEDEEVDQYEHYDDDGEGAYTGLNQQEEEEEVDQYEHYDEDGNVEGEKPFESLSYVEQQKRAKRDFLNAGKKGGFKDDDDEDSDNDSDGDDLFKKKVSDPAADKEKEEKEFENFKSRVQSTKKLDKEDVKLIENYWKPADDEKIDAGEKFLREYLSSNKWLDESNNIPSYDDIIDEIEEDELDIDEQDRYEKSYNFRFEEPGSSVLISNPRDVKSLRRETSSRKEKRQKAKEKKEQEQVQRDEKIKQLKNQKKREILEKIKEVNGLTGSSMFNMTSDDIKKLDPELIMKQLKEHKQPSYTNEYDKYFYSNDQGEVFDDEEFEQTTSYINQQNQKDGDENGEEEEEYNEEEEEEPEYDPYDQYETYDDEPQVAKNGKNKKGNKGWDLQAMADSGLFDDEEGDGEEWDDERLQKEKAELEAMLDKYYEIDYQDMIDDDTPVRFRYTKVEPESYGLSMEDILTKDDAELDKVIPIDMLAPYRNQWSNYERPNRRYFDKGDSKYITYSRKTFTPMDENDQGAFDRQFSSGKYYGDSYNKNKTNNNNNNRKPYQNNNNNTSNEQKPRNNYNNNNNNNNNNGYNKNNNSNNNSNNNNNKNGYGHEQSYAQNERYNNYNNNNNRNQQQPTDETKKRKSKNKNRLDSKLQKTF